MSEAAMAMRIIVLPAVGTPPIPNDGGCDCCEEGQVCGCDCHDPPDECSHDWSAWHWFITSEGWVRFCPSCESWDPTYDVAEKRTRAERRRRPAEGVVCTVCEPGRSCIGRGNLGGLTPKTPRPHAASFVTLCPVCKKSAWATRLNEAGQPDPDGEIADHRYRCEMAVHTDELGMKRCAGTGGPPTTG